MIDSKPVIVALDYADLPSALNMALQLDPATCRVKLGKQLFTAAGPKLVERLVGMGFEVFLDLKFHDIPNTVAAACASAAELGVWMVNVHASGGSRMLQAAHERLQQFSQPPLLIAVTVLTSMHSEDLQEIGIQRDAPEQVLALAGLAAAAGLDGVVCSGREAGLLRRHFADNLQLVTPGIRPAGSDPQDQVRVMTPLEALAAGSNYLVIGRPITAAKDPQVALQAINDSLRKPLNE